MIIITLNINFHSSESWVHGGECCDGWWSIWGYRETIWVRAITHANVWGWTSWCARARTRNTSVGMSVLLWLVMSHKKVFGWRKNTCLETHITYYGIWYMHYDIQSEWVQNMSGEVAQQSLFNRARNTLKNALIAELKKHRINDTKHIFGVRKKGVKNRHNRHM